MAKYTSAAAVAEIGNRFDLVLVASMRVRALRAGDPPKVNQGKCGPVVTALREVEEGTVGREYLKYYGSNGFEEFAHDFDIEIY